jgi:predicted negative regulator of RcsB-dependent stress response
VSDHNLSDQEAKAMLAQWWVDSGRTIVLMVILGVALSFGWQYFKHWQAERRLHIFSEYQSLLVEVGGKKMDEAVTRIAHMQQTYPHSIYTALASFWLAKYQAVERHKPNYEAAVAAYQWVINHSGPSKWPFSSDYLKPVRQLARLSAVQVLLQMKALDRADAMLATVDDPTYQVRIDQLKGDLAYQRKHFAQAKLAYRAAKQATQLQGLIDPLLVLKLSWPMD